MRCLPPIVEVSAPDPRVRQALARRSIVAAASPLVLEGREGLAKTALAGPIPRELKLMLDSKAVADWLVAHTVRYVRWTAETGGWRWTGAALDVQRLLRPPLMLLWVPATGRFPRDDAARMEAGNGGA